MQTRTLKTLVRIETLGSFAKVADELNTSVSTVSMQMKALEKELGTRLFDRDHRPPKLTPQGRQVASQARAILIAEKSIHDICETETGLAGVYHVGFVATASVRILPGFLANAFKKAPRARFEVETALSETLEDRLVSGLLDFAVLTESQSPATGLTYHLLREEEMVYAVPARFKGSDLTTVAKELPFLQFNPSSGIGKLIEANREAPGSTKARSVIVLESVEAIMACLNEGLGYTLLAKPDIMRYAAPNVELFTPQSATLTRRMSLAVAQEKLKPGELESLLELFE